MYAWLLCFTHPCLAGDTLNASLNITGNGFLVSAGKKFELGFFSPLNVTGGKGRYLGMWYHRQEDSEDLTVVWVANRDNPVAVDSTGVFQIAEDGNLMESKCGRAFEHPIDTFLPGMNMDRNLKLTSWRNLTDPGSGNFTFKMEDNRFIILNHDQLYWESEEQGILNSKTESDDDMSTEVYILLTNFTVLDLNSTKYENTRLLLNYTGMIQFLLRGNFQSFVGWFQPKTYCLTYNACGNFTSCNDNVNDNYNVCKCLPGFNDENNDMGKGRSSPLLCTRKSAAACGKDTTKVDESDIAPTPRTCKPCGTNTVPYPLSTGLSCGDPAYFKFSCNISTGQLSFHDTNNNSYERKIALKFKQDANKLGKGGYGPVYKGKLEGGQDIAVKRLSSVHHKAYRNSRMRWGDATKISDFGLARIFGGKETEASTERVVGTYGYMSPEYALDGHFSTKSDVFSFGVMAWGLWTENKLVDLVDLSLRETYNANQFIKCAHIGLLCVQDEPNDRPNMSNVVTMLDSETATLPTPKQPTFFTRKDLSSTASSSLQFESNIQEGR
ncbi:S-locus glycoprotein domain [Sesbania bispinosa]|nr:S-locus glycoprotein domain [Sesbania bispinosa]